MPSVLHASSYSWTLPSGAIGTSNTNSITVNYGLSAVSGDITVKGVNAYGVGGTSSLAVTVNPRPATPVITQIGNTLNSSAAEGNQWYNQNGIINGAVNQDYTVTADGDYYVSVTLLGCTSEISNTLSVLLTGLEGIETSEIKVYPNPVSNELIIEPADIKTVIGFEISNSSGQLVVKSTVAGKIIVPMATLPAGIYFIKLSDGTVSEFWKLIKQ